MERLKAEREALFGVAKWLFLDPPPERFVKVFATQEHQNISDQR